jgi:hypothetical protein
MRTIPFIPAYLLLTQLSIHSTAAQPISSGQERGSKRDTSAQNKTHEELFEELLRGKTGTITPVPPPNPLRFSGSPIFPNVNISADTAPQNEPSVRISHKNPNRVVAAWRDFRTGVTPAVRRVGYSFSNDGGATWSAPNLLPQDPEPFVRHSDPAVCVDTAGNFYIATVAVTEGGDGKLVVFKSNPSFDFFDQSYFVPTDTLPNFYDKEYIECDLSPSSPYVNNLYVVWKGVGFSRSTNGGVDWSDSVRPSDPGAPADAPDLCVGPDGLVGVIWRSILGVDTSYLRFDRSTDGGVTFGTDVVIDTIIYNYDCLSGSLDPGFPSIAADITSGQFSGKLYAVWSSAREGDYDIILKSSTDGGATWSDRRRVNEDPVGNGRHQFWPWIAVDDRGVVTIVYYDNRNTPDSCTITDTYLAYSWDGGLTFTNVLLTTVQSPKNMPNGEVRFGDYIGIDSWGGHTIPVWTDERGGGFDQDVYTAVLDTLPLIDFSGITYNLRDGWNLVSVPLENGSDSTVQLFPGALTGAFRWNGAYEETPILAPGEGYWIKYPTNRSMSVFGDSIVTDTIALLEGWNLVGSPVNPIPVINISSDPPGLITGPFYGYAGTYQIVDSLLPGSGYWVKSSQSGSLFMGGDLSPAPLTARIVINRTGEGPPPPPFSPGAGEVLPGSPVLLGNYPNPFNPTTKIDYSLPKGAHVSITVYNIFGEMVRRIVNEFQSAGSKSITFDAGDYSSGVYFYRMRVGNYSEMKKMILLK